MVRISLLSIYLLVLLFSSCELIYSHLHRLHSISFLIAMTNTYIFCCLFFSFLVRCVWKESVRKEFSRSFFFYMAVYVFTCISLVLISPSQTNAFFLLWFLSKYTKKKKRVKRNAVGRAMPIVEDSPVNNCWYLFSELQMKCIKLYGQLFVFVPQKRLREKQKPKTKKKKNVEYNRRKTSSLLIIVSFSWLFSEKFLRAAKTSAG